MTEVLRLEDKIQAVTDSIEATELAALKKELGCLNLKELTSLRVLVKAKNTISAATKEKLQTLLAECQA